MCSENELQFVIAGSGKSGTTTLHAMLSSHPGVCMSSIKEPRFFTRCEQNELFPRAGTYSQGISWYLSLFEDKSKFKGESSTIYFTAPDSPDLLYDHNPNLKFIFLLRQPTARFYSHYWQEVKTGSIQLPFNKLFVEGNPRIQRYRENSSYEKHVQKYIDKFGNENIKIIISEEFFKNTEEGLNSINTFLNLSNHINHDALVKNKASRPRSRILSDVLRLGRKKFGANVNKLPAFMQHYLKSIQNYLLQKNEVITNYPELSVENRSQLDKLFVRDVEFVEKVLDRKIAVWRNSCE